MLPYLRSKFYFHLSTHTRGNVIFTNTKLILQRFIVFTYLKKKKRGQLWKMQLRAFVSYENNKVQM